MAGGSIPGRLRRVCVALTRLGVLVGLLAASVVVVAHAPVARADASGQGGDFVPLPLGARLFDTRNGTGGVTGPLGADSTTVVSVLGHAGVPSIGVRAVLVSLTTVSPTTATWLTCWPDGTSRTDVSMVNAGTGQAISNSAVVQVGANGKIDVYNHAGSTQVVIDVHGYFTSGSTGGTGRGGFFPVPATRIVDTRTGIGVPKATIPAGGNLTATLATGPVPATANAVFFNLTVPNATTGGFISAYPAGGPRQTGVTLDFPSNSSTAAGAAVQVGTNGQVTFENHSPAAIQLVVDAQGYFSADSTEGAGLRTASARLLSGVTVPANSTIDVSVGGAAGLPTRGVAGAVLNLTAGNSTKVGFLRAWPTGSPEPTTANTNFPVGPDLRADLTVVKPGDQGKITIRNAGTASVDVFVDLEGWFADPLPRLPIDQFTPVAAMQATPAAGATVGTLEYAYTDNIGELVYGHQSNPSSFVSVQWTVISGLEAFTGQPGLAEQQDGRLHIIGHNADSNIWVDTQTTKDPPVLGPWVGVGGSMTSHPTVVRQSDGTLVLFAVDADGALWYLRQGTPNGPYTAWQYLGDANLAATPVAVLVSTGIQLFARNTTGTLQTALFNGGALSAWTSLGVTTVTGTPSVVVYPGSLLRVFTRATDGTILTQIQDATGTFPGVWDTVAGLTAAGSPSALLSPLTGKTEVVARGTDGAIYSTGETTQGSGTWRTWINATQSLDAATDPTTFRFTDDVTATWAFVYRTPNNAVRAFSVNTSQTETLPAHALPVETPAPDTPTFTANTLPAPPS